MLIFSCCPLRACLKMVGAEIRAVSFAEVRGRVSDSQESKVKDIPREVRKRQFLKSERIMNEIRNLAYFLNDASGESENTRGVIQAA